MPKRSKEYWDRWEQFQRTGKFPKSNKNVSRSQAVQGNLSTSDQVPNRSVKKSKPLSMPEDPYYGKPKTGETPDGALF